jgi:transposase
MSKLYWLSDAEWSRLEPLLPRGWRGAHRADDRRVISGIVHMLRSGRAGEIGRSDRVRVPRGTKAL